MASRRRGLKATKKARRRKNDIKNIKDRLDFIGSALKKVDVRMGEFVLNKEMGTDTDQDLALLKYLPEGPPQLAEIISDMFRKKELRKERELQCDLE